MTSILDLPKIKEGDLEGQFELNKRLVQACRYGDYNECESLLNQGADPDYRGSSPEISPLSEACMSGYDKPDSNYNIIRLLLERGARIKTAEGEEWNNLIEHVIFHTNHWSKTHTLLDTLKLLSQYGAKVVSFRALVNAGKENKTNMKFLLDHCGGKEFLNADVINRVVAGTTRKESVEVLEMLIKEYNMTLDGLDKETLYKAFCGENLHMIQFLFDHGFQPKDCYD